MTDDSSSATPAQGRFTVFWSCQNDSPSATNQSFVSDCLERAAKRVGKSAQAIISVDRDTRGVSGSPDIVSTILSKIRSADVFVWDATLAYSKPRASPNPNVMLELGYALAALGERRVIGVLNLSAGAAPDELPFDLKHKRWPLTYSMWPSLAFLKNVLVLRRAFRRQRAAQRDALVDALETALREALNSPKESLGFAQHDFHVAGALWKMLNSSAVQDWKVSRRN